jgi:hypothetical protein
MEISIIRFRPPFVGRITVGFVVLISLLSITYAEESGYLLSADSHLSVWWAEGAYKVMKQDPVPRTKSAAVRLDCARNEYEPFILVLRPKEQLEGVQIEAGPLVGPRGRVILPDNISIYHVGYVNIVVPTDSAGSAGAWPDPLPPYDGAFSAEQAENHPLWITVFVPAEAEPGEYQGSFRVSFGSWKAEIPVVLRVWSFALPEETHIRSSFGIHTGDIRRYHNLETKEELEQVVDLYYKNFKNHRLAPTSPLFLYPMRVKVKGMPWSGGEFVTESVYAGRRALKVEDDSISASLEAAYREKIRVDPKIPYELSWQARTGSEGQDYTVLIQCYDDEGRFLPRWNRLQIFKGRLGWKQETMQVSGFASAVKTVDLHFFPVFRDEAGALTGTAWFDDISFGPSGGAANLLSWGDMEINTAALTVGVDFSDFDRGAKHYLDDFRFNAFNLPLQGLGSGSFHSRAEGIFAGFRQGTPEYDHLLSQYLHLVERHLSDNRWLGKEYIYWFDEPDPKDYPFVREGMLNIRRAAPRLTRFITEHKPGPDIVDVSEISCTIFHRVEPAAVARLSRQGREFWSYLCTGPKAPWVTLFIDHPAVNLRIWLWMSYKFNLKGILVWRANYWNSPTVFPPEQVQNPWEDPMSYTVGYGTPYGQVLYWGNGDGRFLYPPNRRPNEDRNKYIVGPVNSVRWEILREGIEDYEYFCLLEKAVENAASGKSRLAAEGRKLLDFPPELFRSGQDYTKDPKVLLKYRSRIADVLEKLLQSK